MALVLECGDEIAEGIVAGFEELGEGTSHGYVGRLRVGGNAQIFCRGVEILGMWAVSPARIWCQVCWKVLMVGGGHSLKVALFVVSRLEIPTYH